MEPPLTGRLDAARSMLEIPSTAELVQRAQNGDQGAFEHLYRQNAGRVYALCLRMSADPARAEELTQAVFVRAWQKLSDFRGDAAFSSWLHRIAVNTTLQGRRGARRRIARNDAYASTSPRVTQPRDVSARIDLERAIGCLPSGARTMFVLHDVEGYRQEEIADMLSVAVGTVKSQLHRARRLLREALDR